MKKSYYLYIRFNNDKGEDTTNKLTYIGNKGIAGAFDKINTLLGTVFDISEDQLLEVKVSVGVGVLED